MFTAKFASRLASLATIAALATGCNDATSPTLDENSAPASDTPAASPGDSAAADSAVKTAGLAQTPSFAVTSESGMAGQISVEYPSVACGSYRSLGIRSVTVTSPFVQRGGGDYIRMTVILMKYTTAGWVEAGRRVFSSPVGWRGVTFAPAKFGSIGAGYYTVRTYVEWSANWGGTWRVVGNRVLSYNEIRDYAVGGEATLGTGFCRIR